MISCPCDRRPTTRGWATAIAVVFSSAFSYPDTATRWLARLPAAVLFMIPTALVLGLIGLLP